MLLLNVITFAPMSTLKLSKVATDEMISVENVLSDDCIIADQFYSNDPNHPVYGNCSLRASMEMSFDPVRKKIVVLESRTLIQRTSLDDQPRSEVSLKCWEDPKRTSPRPDP